MKLVKAEKIWLAVCIMGYLFITYLVFLNTVICGQRSSTGSVHGLGLGCELHRLFS